MPAWGGERREPAWGGGGTRASEQRLEGGRPGGSGVGIRPGKTGGRLGWPVGGCPRVMLIKPTAGKHHLPRSFLQESCAAWIYCCAQRSLITTF